MGVLDARTSWKIVRGFTGKFAFLASLQICGAASAGWNKLVDWI